MGYLIMFLVGVLTAIGTKKDHSGNSDTETSKSNCNASPDRPIAVVSVPPTPTNEERAKQKKKDRRETIKFRTEIIGAAVLTVYAGFTILTWWQVKKSADASRQQSVTQERQAEFSRRIAQLNNRSGVPLTSNLGLYYFRPETEMLVVIQFHGMPPEDKDLAISNMTLYATMEFRSPSDVPQFEDIPQTPVGFHVPSNCLKPNGNPCLAYIWTNLPAATYNNFIANRVWIYAWGRVYYSDKLGPEWYDFCSYISFDEARELFPPFSPLPLDGKDFDPRECNR